MGGIKKTGKQRKGENKYRTTKTGRRSKGVKDRQTMTKTRILRLREKDSQTKIERQE